MIVSQVIHSIESTVREIVNGLANRLTARDNWGPEGERGQVLTSNGPGENDLPPSFQDLADILGGITGDNAPGLVGPAGPAGPTGPDGAAGADGPIGPAGFMPTYIGPGETFTIPVNMQGLYALPITIDVGGVMQIDGDLVLVS